MNISDFVKRVVGLRTLTPEEKRVLDAQKRGLRTKRSVFHFEIRKDDGR